AKRSRRFMTRRSRASKGKESKVGGQAEAQVGDGVAGFEAAAEAEAEEGGVVLEVGGAERGAAAEPRQVEVGVVAALAGDEGVVEVVDPLPHQPVQVVDAPVVAERRADGRRGVARGPAVEADEPLAEALL